MLIIAMLLFKKVLIPIIIIENYNGGEGIIYSSILQKALNYKSAKSYSQYLIENKK